jgi:hypothetical protein
MNSYFQIPNCETRFKHAGPLDARNRENDAGRRRRRRTIAGLRGV